MLPTCHTSKGFGADGFLHVRFFRASCWCSWSQFLCVICFLHGLVICVSLAWLESNSYHMENDIYMGPLVPTTDQSSHGVFNAVSSHMFASPFMQPETVAHHTHEHIMGSSSSPSTVQDQLLNSLFMPNNIVPNGRIPISETMPCIRSSSTEDYRGNPGMGTPLSATLHNIMSSDVGSKGSLLNSSPSTSALHLNMRCLDSFDSSNSSYPVSRNHIYGSQNHDDFLKDVSAIHPSYYVIGGMLPGWNLDSSALKLGHSGNYLPRNELSLSLGSYKAPAICMPDVPDQCSDKSSSIVTQVTPRDNEELSLCCGPPNSTHFSRVLLGSRYLDIAQQLLADVVSHALGLGNSDDLDDSISENEGEVRMSSDCCSIAKGLSGVGSSNLAYSREMNCQRPVWHQELDNEKPEKTKLITILNMVDQRYNQCLNHIQNIIATFRDATNSSSPQMLAHYALRRVSSTFKNLRKKISSHIRLASQEHGGGCMRGKEKAFDSSFVEKQWALQLGRKEQQSWRPQRGLPERSVSVLRAWMFQNFLHPYPKDNDKHLLALQSGLTRNQVSNWFINARVRLWKPMIEEMYAEIRARQAEEDVNGNLGGHGNCNQIPRLN